MKTDIFAPAVRISLGIDLLVAIVLSFLKVFGVITWSWWWILCPFWIGFPLFLVLFIAVVAAIMMSDQ